MFWTVFVDSSAALPLDSGKSVHTTRLIGGYVEPRFNLDALKGNNHCPLSVIELRFLSRPARSLVSHRLYLHKSPAYDFTWAHWNHCIISLCTSLISIRLSSNLLFLYHPSDLWKFPKAVWTQFWTPRPLLNDSLPPHYLFNFILLIIHNKVYHDVSVMHFSPAFVTPLFRGPHM
jgi:hypothetical protein